MRCGENRHVDIVAGFDVLEDRTATDDARRDGFYAFEDFFPPRNKLDRSCIGRHADRQARPRGRVDEVGRNAKIRRVVGNTIE
jgi:hypothetical protein